MIYPAPGYVLIEIVDPEEQTKEGLYLGAAKDGKLLYGKIIEIGKPKILEGGMVSDAPSFIVKDTNHKLNKESIVIFKQYTQHEVSEYVEDKRYALLSFEAILAVKI